MREKAPDCDYIVVGSGAGGGTVAARLAEAGHRVIVIEAGGDPLASAGPGLPEDYRVPAFHGLSSENPAMAWNFGVSHFDDPAEAARDPKCRDGAILYPRSGALGGCTAHNAMIFMPPPDEDWDELARLSGDPGWSAKAMRPYRRRVEACRHRPLHRWLARIGIDVTGHGWRGWLPVERSMPEDAARDRALVRTMLLTALEGLCFPPGWSQRLRAALSNWGDPNDERSAAKERFCYVPLATKHHVRFGTRDRLAAVARRWPGQLRIITDALATGLVYDRDGGVCGIDYLAGAHLYRASPKSAAAAPGTPHRLIAAREVILAGGTFNTPQLLMLSGIGDVAELARLGILARVHLPDVGRNLQDRYEVAVVHRMAEPWASLKGARFEKGDPLYRRWLKRGSGLYGSNGAAIATLRRSTDAQPTPDLFLMALLGRFSGYFPGYARDCMVGLDGLSWAILKGRTGNRTGTVTLCSRDPRDVPRIAFCNFAENGDADLAAVVRGIGIARDLARPLRDCGAIAEELSPGDTVQGAALADWARATAWGHHACGTAAIGPVLDSRLRVRGVRRLRVVDASIFPRIPGLFIVAAIYQAAEKAADMILEESGGIPEQPFERA